MIVTVPRQKEQNFEKKYNTVNSVQSLALTAVQEVGKRKG